MLFGGNNIFRCHGCHQESAYQDIGISVAQATVLDAGRDTVGDDILILPILYKLEQSALVPKAYNIYKILYNKV